jgi:hypothetical protein
MVKIKSKIRQKGQQSEVPLNELSLYLESGWSTKRNLINQVPRSCMEALPKVPSPLKLVALSRHRSFTNDKHGELKGEDEGYFRH